MAKFTVDQAANYLSSGYWAGRTPVNLGSIITVDLSSLTPANEYLARAAISAWADLGLNFSFQSGGDADIRLEDDRNGAYTDWTHPQDSGWWFSTYYPRVNVGPDYTRAYGSEYGGNLSQTWLHEIGRAEYVPIMDDEALEAFQLLTKLEGIIPALEPSHAIAEVIKRAPKMGKDQIILMNLSGRGDKDIFTVGKILGMEL